MKKILRLLIRQSQMDFRKRYLGTILGGIWAIIAPLMTIGLIYFVFTFGLKTGVIGNISFINWLVPGMLIWFYINEALMAGCTSIIDSSHLVTKVVFPVYILPFSKIISALPVHLLLMFIFLIILFYGDIGNMCSWWQIFYYLLCATVLCIALSFTTSAGMVFIRDTVQVLSIILQALFWATPIFWDPAMIAHTRLRILLFSPFNYVVQGYRDALFTGVNFWDKPIETTVFWFFVLFFAAIGRFIFYRTRPHFADVL